MGQTSDTPWLDIDQDARVAKLNRMPAAEAALFPLDVQLVVEPYSPSL